MPLLERFLSVLAPFYCLGCGHEGSLLCGYCSYGMPSVPSRCYRCYAATTDHAVCEKCRRVSALKYVWIRTLYEGVAEEVVRTYKFNRALEVHKSIASQMLESLPYISKDTVVISVPTATARQRLRGYDHAGLLARHVAYTRGLLKVSPLARISQSRQVGASRRRRFTQLETAFKLVSTELVKDKQILLVDDVVTTGATLETSARLLKRAGAKEINAVVFAQKL